MIRNSRFAKVAVSAGLIVASGAAVLGITSFASAKVATNRAAQVQVSESAVLLADSATQASSTDEARPNPIATVATALGVSESDLVAQLTAGKSIADVAKAQGVDIDKVIAALTDAFKAHLDAEVKSGKHTQAQADAKLAEFKTRVTTMVNTAGLPPMRGNHGGKGGHGARFATENLAKVLKLTAAELITELRSGKSLADIAKAQNVDIADVKDVLVSDFEAHLDAEVKSGEHTQAEADAKLAEFKTRVDDMVNRVRPAGGPGMDGHRGKGGHGGHRGHGGPGHDGFPPSGDNTTDPEAQDTSLPA